MDVSGHSSSSVDPGGGPSWLFVNGGGGPSWLFVGGRRRSSIVVVGPRGQLSMVVVDDEKRLVTCDSAFVTSPNWDVSNCVAPNTSTSPTDCEPSEFTKPLTPLGLLDRLSAVLASPHQPSQVRGRKALKSILAQSVTHIESLEDLRGYAHALPFLKLFTWDRRICDTYS